MPLEIKINGVDKTDQINWKKFKIQSILTNQIDTLNFELKNYGTKTYAPSVLDEVEVLNDSVKIFGGVIIGIDESIDGLVIKRSVKCKDYSHYFDAKLVVAVYEDMTVAEIIEDIVTNYCPGFTFANVSCDQNVSYIAFNYEYPSKCVKQLAELFNYDWYLDYDKDVHFFSKEENLAPFDLDDTSGKFVFGSLVLNRKADQIRNVIYVRGGEYKGNASYEEQIADGQAEVFSFGFKYDNVVVTVAGSAKTLGIDNITDPTTKDCLYNFNEKLIKFRSDNKPTAGQVVRIDGNPYAPVIIIKQDDSSIAGYKTVDFDGKYEFKIIDSSIKSKEGARQRAKAELYAYASRLSEGSFKTYEPGLIVGQKIHLNSTIWGYDEWFIINRITSAIRVPATGEMEYICTLVTTKTMGIIDVLQRLLTAEDKKIEIKKDEVLDKVFGVYENVRVTEIITRAANIEVSEVAEVSEVVTRDPMGAGVIPITVVGLYVPTDPTDPYRNALADSGFAY